MKRAVQETEIVCLSRTTIDEYLKAKEVAEELGVCRATVYKYIYKGEFPNATKDSSGQHLIPYADIEQYRKNHSPQIR